MENVSIIHADGTFKIVPKKFHQLLIIHCVFSDFLIPVFYAVMISKSGLLYDALFLSIRNFLLRKFKARHPTFWVFIIKLHEIIKSYCVELKQIENGQKTRRRKAKFSKAVDSAIRDAEEKLQNERINTTEFLIRVGGATERSFRKMELLKEFEEEEENNAPDDINDDDNYGSTDLFCEEDHDEDYDLCSGCDEKPIAHLVQPCGHMICTNCVQKNNCQLCGCRISNNITIHFDEVE